MKAKISERGNGLPTAGDYVAGSDGELYRIESTEGPIHTGSAGCGNYLFATVELADWSDCSEEDEFPALAVLEAEEEQEEYGAEDE